MKNDIVNVKIILNPQTQVNVILNPALFRPKPVMPSGVEAGQAVSNALVLSLSQFDSAHCDRRCNF